MEYKTRGYPMRPLYGDGGTQTNIENEERVLSQRKREAESTKHAAAIKLLHGLFRHEECYAGNPCDFDMGIHTAISELEEDEEPNTPARPKFQRTFGSRVEL